MTFNSHIKSLVFLIASILLFNSGNANAGSTLMANPDSGIKPPQCEKPWGATAEDSLLNLRKYFFFQSAFDMKDINTAYEHWQFVMKTIPCARQAPYDVAPELFDSLMVHADSVRRLVLIDSSLNIFPEKIKYFGDEGYVKGQWALEYKKHKPADFKGALDLFKQSIDIEKGKTGYDIPIPYFRTAYKMYAKKQLTKEQVVEIFIALSDIMDENISKKNEELAAWKQVSAYVSQLMGGILSCEEIVKLFEQKLKDNPDDMKTRVIVVKLMKGKGCKSNPMYFRVLEELIEKQPDEKSYEELANFYRDKGSFAKANFYLLKALELSSDSAKKENYYLNLSNNSLKINCGDARKYAEKALEINPNNGQAIMLKGHALYKCAVAACKDFDKSAASWIAVDYMRKAMSIDPSVTDAATSAIASYRKGYPKKDEKFFRNLKDGDSYTLTCIGITTTVK